MGHGIPEAAIVTSILEEDAEATEGRFASLPPQAALLEIRADHLRADEVAGLVRRAPRPAIVAVRTARDGGRFDGSEGERGAILEAALAAGAALVDVEAGGALAGLVEKAGPDRTVISHHGGPCTATALARIYRDLTSGPRARLKIVPRAEAPGEAAHLRELLRRARDDGHRLAAFAMGPAGLATRVFAVAWGSFATYGAAAPRRATADGQPTAGDLAEVYRVLEIGSGTRTFGLAGRPLGESPSPAIHASAYRAAGIDAVFLPLEIERFEDALELCGPDGLLRIEALGVTIPFKERAAALAEPADAGVAASGSANTLVFGPGRPRAFNTDAPAALAILSRAGDLVGVRAAVVGAGGTGKAIAAALRGAGSRVTIYNRDGKRGAAAAAALGVSFAPIEELPAARWEVLVNATPLGREGEPLMTGGSFAGRVVLDAAYSSRETPLVAAARAAGLVVADGFDLLGAQAALQFERMTGCPVDAAWMTGLARRRVARRSNSLPPA